MDANFKMTEDGFSEHLRKAVNLVNYSSENIIIYTQGKGKEKKKLNRYLF